MIRDVSSHDVDPVETQEWLDALQSVFKTDGNDRVEYILQALAKEAVRLGIKTANFMAGQPYVNTIDVGDEPAYPGDLEVERRILAINRWNSVCMVLHATKNWPELGGHLSTFASSAVLYSVGWNHFFRGFTDEKEGDLVYYQGHASPGMYAQAYLEGRLSPEQLGHFRREIGGHGLSSYPHPWLMPDFWQFATVSMGLGPIQAIYQARFLKYLDNRGLVDTKGRKVWAFCGDGEMDEPESLGAIHIAKKEGLDNLIFVVNCNLQRLDGPVRGNGSIIRELEGVFLGAGWKVIKVLWGKAWDALFLRDKSGLLVKRMSECVDGDYQLYRSRDGAYVREHFFGAYPELKALVADMSDEEIWNLKRGGHDFEKVYAAFKEATNSQSGIPTVVLAHTVKGYGLPDVQSLNIAHNQKKLTQEQLKVFRDYFKVPVSDDELDQMPFYRPEETSEEIQYIRARRKALGGYTPARRVESVALPVPDLSVFQSLLESTGDREISNTMAFVRILNIIMKDKELGKRVVPIVPDESRTFGMEGMFRQYGIYSPVGQLYEPVDRDQVMYYKEAKEGQVLEEGLTEAGAFSSFIAAGTSYSNNNYPMLPFYIYYSMFGFQRIGDLAWAAGDMRTRGFLLGAIAGRTTLAGEGLQHQDGHSHILAGTIPNCVSYDPCYSYELAVIIQDGLRRMYQNLEFIYYYITITNENYTHPEMPNGVEEGILKGMYLFSQSSKPAMVQLLGSGTILREVIAAAEILEKEFEVPAQIWSVTSFNELARDGMDVDRWNTLHPTKTPKQSYVTACLSGQSGPVVAASDYIKIYAEQIRPFVPANFYAIGTDGFGRSDTREALRQHFENDRYYIVVAALKALADEGKVSAEVVAKAIKQFKIDTEKKNPLHA